MYQTKEHDKTPEELNEMEIGDLPEKEFRVIVVKMIKELKRRTDAQSEKLKVLNKELENIKNDQTEVKYAITKMKNALEGINNRLNDSEEQISELEDKSSRNQCC